MERKLYVARITVSATEKKEHRLWVASEDEARTRLRQYYPIGTIEFAPVGTDEPDPVKKKKE